VVFGAFARLTLAVSHSDVQHVRLLVPPVSSLAMWAGMMGTLAAAIAWVSVHDLRLSRRHQTAACRIGAFGTVTWLGLLLVVAGFGTFVGVHHVPVQALTLHP
jgi:Na+/proline symporter